MCKSEQLNDSIVLRMQQVLSIRTLQPHDGIRCRSRIDVCSKWWLNSKGD